MRFGANLPDAEGGGEKGEASPEIVEEGGESEGGVIESEGFEGRIDGVHGWILGGKLRREE